MPKSEEAACILGQDSEWCTSWGEKSPVKSKQSKTSHYRSYRSHDLYIIQNKKKPSEIYQFDFESGEYMDKGDNSITLSEFLNDNPKLQEYFESQGKHGSKVRQALELAGEGEDERAIELLNQIDRGANVIKIDGDIILVDVPLEDGLDHLFDIIFGRKFANNDWTFFEEFANWVGSSELKFYTGEVITLRYDENFKENYQILEILTQDEKKEIIRNLVKEEPSKYKPLLSSSNTITFLDIMKQKLSDDKDLENKLSLGLQYKVNTSDQDPKKLKKLKEIFEKIFHYMGFVYYEGNEDYPSGWKYQLYIDYSMDDDYLDFEFQYDSIIDRIYNYTSKSVQDLELKKKEIIQTIINTGKYLKETVYEPTYTQIFAVALSKNAEKYITGEPVINQIRDTFVKEGYLSTSTIPTGDDPAQEKLKFEIKRLNEISDRQRAFFDQNEFEIIEEISLDDYDLLLLYHPEAYQGHQYTVGFQKKGRDFTDPFDQNQREPTEDINFKDLIKIPKILQKWINQHGELVIGSYNAKKTKVYRRVFERYGFNIMEKNMYGVEALIIS